MGMAMWRENAGKILQVLTDLQNGVHTSHNLLIEYLTITLYVSIGPFLSGEGGKTWNRKMLSLSCIDSIFYSNPSTHNITHITKPLVQRKAQNSLIYFYTWC